MGFIQSAVASKVTLQAFLTQKGREYLVKGAPEDFTITHFALGDPDTNYLQAAETTAQGLPNVLPAGFIPDLSGDYSGAIHSMAGGVVQRTFLYGGSAVGQLGSNNVVGGPLSTVGFGPSRLGAYQMGFGARADFQATIGVPVRVTSNQVVGGEQVRVHVLPPSQGTSSFIYPYLSLLNNGIVTWSAGEPAAKNLDLYVRTAMMPALTPQDTAQGGYRFFVYLAAVPYKSGVQVPQATSIFGLELFLYLNNSAVPLGNGTLPPG